MQVSHIAFIDAVWPQEFGPETEIWYGREAKTLLGKILSPVGGSGQRANSHLTLLVGKGLLVFRVLESGVKRALGMVVGTRQGPSPVSRG